jgi:hypothetical protein
LCAEVERLLTVGSASGADHVGAELTCELRHHRTDRAGSAVNEDALARLNAAVLDESPATRSGQASPRSLLPEVDVARQRREVARLDGHILRQGAAPI